MQIKRRNDQLLSLYLLFFAFLVVLALLMGHNAEKEIRDVPLPAINIELERACLDAMRAANVAEFAARRECVERLRSK